MFKNINSILNKNFFRLLSVFFVLIFIGLASVFVAGYYENDGANGVSHFEAKTPGRQNYLGSGSDSSAVQNSFKDASSTASKKSN